MTIVADWSRRHYEMNTISLTSLHMIGPSLLCGCYLDICSSAVAWNALTLSKLSVLEMLYLEVI